MFILSDNNPLLNLFHFLLVFFDHALAKYVFSALASIIFTLIFFRNRSYGEESPRFKDAEYVAEKVVKVLEKLLISGAIGFLTIQLTRIYLLR
ncbi:hypothetical protein DVH26_02760 [Paenibacillus sp. H1-7]|nr:hypothetical protein DVH26_02760 [Paenibacillus sp. H1-7]